MHHLFLAKINGVLVENAEDLDIVMPMYNFLKYSNIAKIIQRHLLLCGIITGKN